MKNKEEKKNRIWVPIVIGALACSAAVGTGIALVHNQQRPKAGTVATMSDAADFSGLTTEVAEVTTEVTTEEATTEAALEVASNESKKPEAVPATTEIGGGKKKAEETTEEQKSNNNSQSNSGSGHSSTSSNSSNNSANNGSSNSSGNNSSGNNSSGSSNSNSSGNSSSNNGGSNNSGSNNSGNNTPQHQHVYNVWNKTKDAWDETVVDQEAYDETITHPAEYKTVPATQCHTCKQIFTSGDAFLAHDAFNGGWCNSSGGTGTTAKEKVKDEWTETKHHDAVTHTVHHDEEGYWTCSCGARE